MLSLQSFLRKGVSLCHVGRNYNLKDLKDQTLNPPHCCLNPKPKTLRSKPCTLNPQGGDVDHTLSLTRRVGRSLSLTLSHTLSHTLTHSLRTLKAEMWITHSLTHVASGALSLTLSLTHSLTHSHTLSPHPQGGDVEHALRRCPVGQDHHQVTSLTSALNPTRRPPVTQNPSF